MDQKTIHRIVRLALKEDTGSGDITTNNLVPADLRVEAVIVAREPLVICGLDLAEKALLSLDKDMCIVRALQEGAVVKAGAEIVVIRGKARAVLTAERIVLNLLGRLSGIATFTRAFTDAVRGTKAVILDTRKTTPGLRTLERYAVRTGCGKNHRFDLSEMVLVKDNHRVLSGMHGSLADMVGHLRRRTKKPIEVEVDTLEELADVLDNPPEMILLDNMSISQLRSAVKRVASMPAGRRPLLEASGGINLKNVCAVAKTGVDRISIGALTHSARCMDVSMEVRKIIDD
ncbi:MAG: carboxylating nicotinate-nucleotide diphosphorylase [Candidatus Omnitrophica bacterium]|nr:carboxylating nicotinate-nucleotide diphosphorylase [Candidatus Omnitrophota bacterium]